MPLRPSPPPLARVVQGALLLAVTLWFEGRPSWSQVADVARPDAQGDFRSVAVIGPRGSYGQRLWLVVDRDPQGLRCRDGNGLSLIALRPGAVLETASGAASLFLLQGKPYLKVRVEPVDLLEDARQEGRGTATACLVRANSAYIAPIHPDSLAKFNATPRSATPHQTLPRQTTPR